MASYQEKKIRIVVAKPGLDGHDRGAKIIARALRDAGMEVIYTGLHQRHMRAGEDRQADSVGILLDHPCRGSWSCCGNRGSTT
jgi:methylmalonyl-CoA mutase C-terminal domain/subunit